MAIQNSREKPKDRYGRLFPKASHSTSKLAWPCQVTMIELLVPESPFPQCIVNEYNEIEVILRSRHGVAVHG